MRIIADRPAAVKLPLRERMRRELEADNEAIRAEQRAEMQRRRSVTFKRLVEILKVDPTEIEDTDRTEVLSVDGIRFSAQQMYESHGYSLVVLRACQGCGHESPEPVRDLLNLARTLEGPEPACCSECRGMEA